MKKRLITILSLVMAFVLCFSLAACGGDKGTNGGTVTGKPTQTDKTVSISLSDAIGAANGMLNADGFTGTASYSLSTKNTKALTESVSLDKRGNKLKIGAGDEEMIVDIQTGYVYYKYGDYYAYSCEFYANAFNYAQYLIADLRQQVADQKIDVRYNAKSKTVTFTVEKADSANKYLEPLQNAYKKDKTVGDLLNDYCKLLFGKTFDAMYSTVAEYVKNPQNTVGSLLEKLKAEGVDVEAILEMYGYKLPADQMTAIKARPLNKVVAGAYKFVMTNLGDMLPFTKVADGNATDASEGDDPDDGQEGGGMALGMALVNAMLFEEVSADDITAGLQGIGGLLSVVKGFKIKETIDMALKTNAEASDLYTVIKDGVKLKNATVTLTLTVDDNKRIMGVKIDSYAAHTYTGTAAEGSFLADNDYRATAEIVIDEYAAPTEDFVITCNPAQEYRESIISLMYEVTDKDVSIYFEAGGQTVDVAVDQGLSVETLDGQVTVLDNVPADAFKFDAATSSFVFDGAVVKSALENADFGTSLYALVYFDGDENDLYAIGIAYVNNDWQAIADYLSDMSMEKILGFIGGNDTPNIGETTSIDGMYYLTDDDENDEIYYLEIHDGQIVTFIEHGNDITENVMLMVEGNEVAIGIMYPETEQEPAHGIVLYGNVYANYINITAQIGVDENGDYIDATECDLYLYKYGMAVDD